MPNRKRATAAKRRPAPGPKKPRLRKGRPELDAPRPHPKENPAAHALARRVAQLVLDKKALDVVVLDVRGMTSYADYFVIASGESDRQVSAMADHVDGELRKDGVRPIGSEGQDIGHWVLLDYGEVVVHLFFTEVRAFYDLEGLWADAPRERVAV